MTRLKLLRLISAATLLPTNVGRSQKINRYLSNGKQILYEAMKNKYFMNKYILFITDQFRVSEVHKESKYTLLT
ncbi:unnamed protein product [Acanthoscelides obtectus]|uniref:Uncharacterized protein n=1 Tax=Acanthoscelides obtectus TaxID=200917 RepID=A0A9P0Q0G7_ACAOB|nr:unnamed protein product [Acanthoscelides obtectus]CAK1663218.1 hypothetical protein AOBTE_LOCUS23557 [Acanthoscelides obtectus]